MTGSGRYFDPCNPIAPSVYLPDIARGLRRGVGSRFNGQLLDPAACPHPQSGIAHSYRVGRLVFWRLTRDLNLDTIGSAGFVGIEVAIRIMIHTLGGMIHDSPEGYVGDALGPIKTDARKATETAILEAIAESLVGPAAFRLVCQAVHEDGVIAWADRVSLRQEALLYQPNGDDWALPSGDDPEDVQARLDIADTLHLFHPREGENWQSAVEQLATSLRHAVSGIGWPCSSTYIDDLVRLMR